MPEPKIIKAKIKVPQLGYNLIARQRLIDQIMYFNNKKLTILSSQAGYGKTALLSQISTIIQTPVAWYQLDEIDNDPVVFGQYLLATVSQHYTHSIGVFWQPTEETNLEKQLNIFLTKLLNQLEKMSEEGLVIIFDDFHFIKDLRVLGLIEKLLRYTPPGIHIIISSRIYPSLRIEKLKVAGLVNIIQTDDLKFNLNEISEFLNINDCYQDNMFNKNDMGQTGFAEETIKYINQITEGWPVAVNLFKLIIDAKPDIKEPRLLCYKNFREVFNYVAAEVFNDLPARLQVFLTSTSVLEEVTPELCDTVFPENDHLDILEEIEKRNLFVIRLTGNKIIYRYHHLFREFLQARLGKRRGKLLNLVGNYYLNLGDFDRAVEYFIRADNSAAVTTTIEKAGFEAFRQGRLQTVERWLVYLQEHNSLNNPQLILLKGTCLSYLGKFAEAEQWIERAIDIFQANMDDTSLCQAVIHQSRIIRYRTSLDDSLRLLDCMIPKFENLPVVYRLESMTEKVFSLWLKGNINSAIIMAEEALTMAKSYCLEKNISRLLAYMTVIYYIHGDYSKAITHYEMIRKEFTSELDAKALGLAGLFIAKLWRDRGEPDQALKMLKEAIDMKLNLGLKEDLHILYFNMAFFYIDLDDTQNAEIYFDTAVEQFEEIGGKQDYYILMIQAVKCALLEDVQANHQNFDNLITSTIQNLRNKSDFFLIFASTFFIIGYIRRGMLEHAENLLDDILLLSERIGMKQSIALLSGLKAGIMVKKAFEQISLPYAIRCLKEAANEQYIQSFLTFPELWPTLSLGIEHDIEIDFVGQVVRRLGARFLPILLELLHNAQPPARMRTIQLLQEIAEPKVCRELSKLFYASDEYVRANAMIALRSIEQKSEQSNITTLEEVQVKLFICCFGTFEVYVSSDWENPVKWRTAKTKELFAYLVHNRKKLVDKEKIIADLWPETSLEQAIGLLHTNIYFLRVLLKSCGLDNNLTFRQGKYKLNLTGVACDSVIFENIYIHTRTSSGPEKILSQQEAVSLYHGEYLAGQDWPWSNNMEEFYCNECLAMLKEISNYYFGKREFTKAINWLETILRISSLDEETHLSLMKAFYELGDRVAVVRQYRVLCKVLNEELRIEPSQRVKELYRQLSGIN